MQSRDIVVDDHPFWLVIGVTLLIGIAVGYGVREFISYRRRTAGRRKARKAHRQEARRLGFKE